MGSKVGPRYDLFGELLGGSKGPAVTTADSGPMSQDFTPSRLAELRKSKGLSQRALAQAAGLSQALIAELERGKHPPSRSSMEKISVALGVAPSDLAS